MHWMDMTMKFEALLQCLEAIDRELLELREVSEGVDADALGLFDDMEELIGEGFLRCQLYMIERKGEHRSQNPFMCGPRHNFVAQIINTAGNYRKHRAEWPFDRARWGPQQLTAADVRGRWGCRYELLALQPPLLHQSVEPSAVRIARSPGP